MIKYLFLILLSIPFIATAQPLGTATTRTYADGLVEWRNAINEKLDDTATTKTKFSSYLVNRKARQSGRIYWNPTGLKFVLMDSVTSGGPSLDTTSLSNRINQKVSYVDTAAMLSPYATDANLKDTAAILRGLISESGTDTSSLSTRIDQRVKYIDTAAMLLPYATDIDLVGKENVSNKTTNANGTSNFLYPTQGSVKSYVDGQNALNLRYTDTASMLAPYATKGNLKDSSATLRNLIATSSIDTSSLSTRINQRVKYTDTTGMLANYVNNASNGLTKYSKNIILGGTLTGATVITTTGSNTLALPGLQSGASTDSVVTSDAATGVLKRRAFPSSGGSGWSLIGNAGTSPGTNFIGTTDNQGFQIKVNNNTLLNFLTDNSILIGNGAISTSSGSIAMGTNASANFLGISVGFGSISSNQGVSVGREARSAVAGTALGYHAEAQNQYSVSLGAGAQAKHDFSCIITDGYSYDNLGTPYTTDSARKLKLIFAKGVDVYSDNTTPVCKILGTGDLIVSRYVKPSLFDYVASNAGTVSVAINTEYAFYGITAIYTMPAVSGNSGKWVRIVNIGTGIITVNSNAGGSDIFTTSAVTTTPVAIGGVVTFKCYTVGANTYWKVSE